MRDETVFGVTNSRYHANPSSDPVFFRRRCNDLTFPWRAVAHYWGEGGNESRQQARVSKVRTDPFFPFSLSDCLPLDLPRLLDDPVFLGPVPKRGELCWRLFVRSSEMRPVVR